ncbi:MAG TPA: MBL fold metallo-hydrolase [Vicinamibacterales bacterium]
MPLHRRDFLAAAAALAGSGLLPHRLTALTHPLTCPLTQSLTRLILLGTAGGPTPKRSASGPAQVILVDGVAYVVDCGDGVARQLRLAGVPWTALRNIFITHHHSDHNADYGNLILLAWASGLATRVDTWGPPPLERMTGLFLEMSKADIDVRMADEGRPPLVPLVHAHDRSDAGLVMRDERVTVTCARVPHPEVEIAFAYRFDTPDRSIVISGDTAPSDALIALARGADVLVHEVMWVPAVDRLVANDPRAVTLKKHIIDSHTSVEDAGRIAQAAGVKTLVLSHFVPADDTSITEEMWGAAARAHFAGRVVVGKDLMEV